MRHEQILEITIQLILEGKRCHFYTKGLDKYKHPEVGLKNVPVIFIESAHDVIMEIIDKVRTMSERFDSNSSFICFLENNMIKLPFYTSIGPTGDRVLTLDF